MEGEIDLAGDFGKVLENGREVPANRGRVPYLETLVLPARFRHQ